MKVFITKAKKKTSPTHKEAMLLSAKNDMNPEQQEPQTNDKHWLNMAASAHLLSMARNSISNKPSSNESLTQPVILIA